jgi:hypothetical protein
MTCACVRICVCGHVSRPAHDTALFRIGAVWVALTPGPRPRALRYIDRDNRLSDAGKNNVRAALSRVSNLYV